MRRRNVAMENSPPLAPAKEGFVPHSEHFGIRRPRLLAYHWNLDDAPCNLGGSILEAWPPHWNADQFSRRSNW
jgi:hypothetical protein